MGAFPRLYTGELEPIVEPGENLLLQGVNTYQLYPVVYVDPLPESPPITVDLCLTGGLRTALAPAASTQNISLYNQVAQNAGELCQVRLQLLDTCRIKVAQEAAITRYTDLNVVAVLTPTMFLRNHREAPMTDMFVHEQQMIFLQATNDTGRTLQQVRIACRGFRYILGGTDGIPSPVSGVQLQPAEKYATLAEAMTKLAAAKIKYTVVPIRGYSGA